MTKTEQCSTCRNWVPEESARGVGRCQVAPVVLTSCNYLCDGLNPGRSYAPIKEPVESDKSLFLVINGTVDQCEKLFGVYEFYDDAVEAVRDYRAIVEDDIGFFFIAEMPINKHSCTVMRAVLTSVKGEGELIEYPKK